MEFGTGNAGSYSPGSGSESGRADTGASGWSTIGPAEASTESIVQRIHRVSATIRLRREIVALGELSDGELAARILSRRLTRLARGAYIEHALWQGLFPEERLLAVTIAHAKLHRSRGWVFARESAAVLWGLPLFDLRSLRVHLSVSPDSPGRSSRPVARHVETLRSGDVIEVAGVRLTSLQRTMLDLAHSAPQETAVGAVDAGLRRLFPLHRGGNLAALEDWREEQSRKLEGSWRPGVRSAREVLRIADGNAESVIESVSRLQLTRLRVPHDMQVPVFVGRRAAYWMDFEFLGQSVFGEVDGSAKYLDPELLAGQTPGEVVLAEKRREDEVRGLTGKRVVRWDIRHVGSARALGQRLTDFGISIPEA